MWIYSCLMQKLERTVASCWVFPIYFRCSKIQVFFSPSLSSLLQPLNLFLLPSYKVYIVSFSNVTFLQTIWNNKEGMLCSTLLKTASYNWSIPSFEFVFSSAFFYSIFQCKIQLYILCLHYIPFIYSLQHNFNIIHSH